MTTADIEAQSSWLISAWDSLVKVHPEFGMLSTPARQEQRRETIASSAVAIYGLIGAMSTMYDDHIDPDEAFGRIATGEDGEGIFSFHNPVWSENGVVTPSGSDHKKLTTRNSFPARRAAIRILHQEMGLSAEEPE